MKATETRIVRADGSIVVQRNRAAQARFEATPDFRRSIIRRDRGLCRYCGRKPDLIEVDHIWPVTRGGQTTYENCVAACKPCNRDKGWSITWRPLSFKHIYQLKQGVAPEGKYPIEQRKRWKVKDVRATAAQARRMEKRAKQYGADRIFRYTGK